MNSAPPVTKIYVAKSLVKTASQTSKKGAVHKRG